jgi:hypothetical protein
VNPRTRKAAPCIFAKKRKKMIKAFNQKVEKGGIPDKNNQPILIILD